MIKRMTALKSITNASEIAQPRVPVFPGETSIDLVAYVRLY